MLSSLLQWASEITGVVNNSAANRATLLRRINRAAREVYDSADLPGSTAENAFNLTTITGYPVITVPWYVDQIVAVRYRWTGRKINLVSPAERFFSTPSRQPILQWRKVGTTPLVQSLTSTGTLTVSFPSPVTEAVKVYISGQTTTAAIATETLTFAPGDDSKVTTNQFTDANPMGITAISKSGITEQDCTITETTTGNTIAVIPNRMLESKNTLVGISDPAYTTAVLPADGLVEVRYKRPFMEYYYDQDQHFDIKLEQAIIYKLQEQWYGAQTDEAAMQRAAVARNACTDILQTLCANIESHEQRQMQYDDNPVELAPLYFTPVLRYGIGQ